MFSSSKAQKRIHSDTSITQSFLDEMMPSENFSDELPSFLFNMSNNKESSIFKTPEVNRNATPNNRTPLQLLGLSAEKTCNKTPSPACMTTSTPKRVDAESLNLSELLNKAIEQDVDNSADVFKKPKKSVSILEESLKNISQINNPEKSQDVRINNPNVPDANHKLRPIGSYNVSLLEKEYVKLLSDLKEERERSLQYISSIADSFKEKVEQMLRDLENMVQERFQILDQNLHEVMDNFELELEAGKATEAELLSLRQKIASIVDLHLQSPNRLFEQDQQ